MFWLWVALGVAVVFILGYALFSILIGYVLSLTVLREETIYLDDEFSDSDA